MLELHAIAARYGAVQALREVNLQVTAGEIVCLIGANGAGKSTVLNCISGVVPCSQGKIRFEGTDIARASATSIVRRGIVQVPEGRLVFPDMTVMENLEMGAFTRPSRRFHQKLSPILELFPRLAERRTQLAGLMSGGEQQMLAIGRALMAEPRLLLLDEPSMGLAPLVILDIFRALRRLQREMGLTILLVEQNARAALALADRGYILTTGATTRHGRARELLDDPAMQEAFLGRAETAGDSA